MKFNLNIIQLFGDENNVGGIHNHPIMHSFMHFA
jgi:hypothetical protein